MSRATDPVRIAVASNFLIPLQQLEAGIESSTGQRLQISQASTGKLYAQILQGAPFDLFLAADERRPELLESQPGVTVVERRNYARGQLALWAPGLGPGGSIEDALATSSRIAIANPNLAPYGYAAIRFLENQPAWGSVRGKLVRGESVTQALQFVATGNATMGLLALSQLQLMVPQPDGLIIALPADAYPPIVQQAVLLSEGAAARQVWEALFSPQTRVRLTKMGYAAPDATR